MKAPAGHPVSKKAPAGSRLFRLTRGLVANSVAFSVLLIAITAIGVGAAFAHALGHQVQEAVDQRLIDSAGLFQASLDDARDDLENLAALAANDPDLVRAIQAGDDGLLRERIALALRIRVLDEIVVARPDGVRIGQARVGQEAGLSATPLSGDAFRQALAGRSTSGISLSLDGLLRLETYAAVRAAGSERAIAVVRLGSFLDERDIDRFRVSTGLHLSLFWGNIRVVTTLRRPDGVPLVGSEGPADVLRRIADQGHPVLATGTLPIGQIRSYYVPLMSPDGSRDGMFAVAVPVRTIDQQIGQALRGVLPITALVVVVGAGLAYSIVRRIRQPVLVLAEAAARLRRGDLTTEMPRVAEPVFAPVAEQLELARLSLRRQVQTSAAEDIRQRAIVAALPEPVVTTSVDDRVMGFNPAATAVFGPLRHSYGRHVRFLLPFVDSPPEQDRWVAPDAGGGSDQDEAARRVRWHGRVADSAGNTLDVEVSRTVLVEGQLPAAHLYVVHDVSRFAELNRLREQLLYNVAHELRAPLAVLDNALEIVASDFGELTAEELNQLIYSARRTSRRLRTLMEDLLSAGTIRSGRFQVTPQPVDLWELIDGALDVAGAAISERNQRIECPVHVGQTYVMADRRFARQVLSNLLANASKYGPENSVIRIVAAPAGDACRVTIQDHGPGIPPAEQVKIFNRFYRVRGEHEEPGIGLGLAIVRGIVEAHGGTVGVESEVGLGTSVWFTLPTAQGPATPYSGVK